MQSQLSTIRIVLLNTYHPGNIGAVARAMKTMGLQELVLVNPNDYPSDEATSRAAGAADVLANAKIVSNFDDAISDCTQIFATTARQKHRYAGPQKPCYQVTQWIKDHDHEKVAIVFGRERTGMSAQDINLCHQILYIPGNPDYDILNIAAAVQIVCYELNKTFSAETEIDEINKACPETQEKNGDRLVSQQESDHFYQQLQSTLESSGYFNPEQPSDTMKRLRQFFNRANPTTADIGMMRGVIKALSRNSYKH